MLKLSSDMRTGKVWLDDQPAGELEGAQWTLDKVAGGEHKLKFEGPQGSATVAFTMDAGSAPMVKGSLVAKGVLVLVVGNLGGRLHIYSSDPGVQLGIDAQAPVAASSDGVEFPQVALGSHQLALIRGADRYQLDLDVGPSPSLITFLESGQNVGTLLVVSHDVMVRVFLYGHLLKQVSQGGLLRIPNLEPRDYIIRVAKAGFQELPEQKVRVRKGEQSKLIFALAPIPRFASLSVQGATPGTEIKVDQVSVGKVQPDGTLAAPNISPGDHVIELRKNSFKPKRLQKHFIAGANVILAGPEAGLEAAMGELKITFSPSDAIVTLAKAGESPIKVTSGSPLNLPPGSYTLSAHTADGIARTSTVELVGGESKAIDLPLAPSGMSKWDDPGSWKSEKGTFVHRGGDFVLYSASPTTGTFGFAVRLLKGRKLQWVLNYVDAANYTLFQMDDSYFYRSVLRKGQALDTAKIPHKMDKKAFQTLLIRVTPNEITHQIREGNAWVALDTWSQPGTNLSLGKFGCYLPGNDQVALSNFSHYAELNPR